MKIDIWYENKGLYRWLKMMSEDVEQIKNRGLMKCWNRLVSRKSQIEWCQDRFEDADLADQETRLKQIGKS